MTSSSLPWQKEIASKTCRWTRMQRTEGMTTERTPRYQAGKKERYRIERKFGEAKQNHGLTYGRYIGRLRYALQAYLTAIALNLKRMVRLLTGTSFKGRARAMA